MKIPNTLDEAIIELQSNTLKEDIDEIKKGNVTTVDVHHTVGRWIRNQWGLWDNSNLRTHFFDMGIHHPDDMSSIILDKFISEVKNEPFDIQKNIDKYRIFWKEKHVDVDAEIERLKNE